MRTFKLKKCNRIHGLHFTPDNQQLLVIGGYEADGINDIAWFDIATGNVVRRLELLADFYTTSPDFHRLVLGTDAYDRSDLGKLVQFCDPQADPIEWHALKTGVSWSRSSSALVLDGLAFTPDGAQLYVGIGRQTFSPGRGVTGWAHRVAVCSFDPAGVVAALDTDGPFGVRAISPDGKRLAATGGPGGEATVKLYARPDRPAVARFDPPQTRTRCLVYSPDGTRVAIANGQKAFLLTADKLTPVAELAGHAKQVNALAFTPGGQRLLSAGHDGAIRLWAAEDGRPVKAFDWGIGPVTAVAVAPDGLTAAVAGKSGQIVVWDLDD
jgi:WD domain, G-beta repeat